MEGKVNRFLVAIYHALVVQFKRNPFKTKKHMKKEISYLDGSEQSMIPILRHGLGFINSDSRKKMVQLEEFSAGTGISDLTVFTLDKRILREQKQSNRKPLTARNQIRVLTAILQSDGVTSDELVAKTKLTKPTLLKILDGLKDAHIVDDNNNTLRANYSLKTASTENIVAIEAKVKDWKSGIRQAMRYKEYADFSYLAIYESHISSCLNNISVFEKLGIGLIGVSDTGLTVHLEAKRSDMTSFESKLLAFERMVSAVNSRHETYVARNGFVTNSSR